MMASLPQQPEQDPNQMPPAVNPFVPNAPLEAQAQAQGQMPMNPLISAIAQHLGMMNMLRARANQQMVASPNTIE